MTPEDLRRAADLLEAGREEEARALLSEALPDAGRPAGQPGEKKGHMTTKTGRALACVLGLYSLALLWWAFQVDDWEGRALFGLVSLVTVTAARRLWLMGSGEEKTGQP